MRFLYTPCASFSEEFTDLFMLVLVRSFLYIPLTSFTDEFYTLDASFSEEFHFWC